MSRAAWPTRRGRSNSAARDGATARPLTRWVAVALVFLLTVVWSGPARADGSGLTLWHAYTGAEEEALLQAVAQYRKTRPDLTVDVVAVAFGAYASKLESAIPTGHGPDVFIDAHERLATYSEARLVRALTVSDELTKEFEPAHLNALTVGEDRFGLPLSVKCAALYINTDLLSEVPVSFEQLIATPTPPDVFPLVMEAESPYYLLAIGHAFGARMIDESGQYAFVGPEAERTVDQVRGWIDAGRVPEESTGELVKRLFSNRKAVAAVSGPWLAPDLPEDLSWKVVPLPSVEAAGGVPAVPFATIEGVFVASETKVPVDAEELARFLAAGPGAQTRARIGKQVVAAKSPWASEELANDVFLKAFRDAAQRALPMPTHPNMRMTWEPTLRALKKTYRSGVPAKDALEEAQRRFRDVTRPPPPPASPTPAFVLIGLLLLGVAAIGVQRVKRPEVREALRNSVPAYKWVAHAFVAVGLLVLLPLFVGGLTSFFAGRGTDLHYVGLANYVEIITNRGNALLSSGSFWLVLLVTVLWTVLNLTLHVGIGLILALLLNRPSLRLRGPYRVMLILPWAVPNYVTALAWKGLFHRQLGAINAILDAVGVEPVSWFAGWTTSFAANLSTNVWLGFPFMMVVTLGALSAIPKDLYEAAAVDGANAWQRFWLITYPMLKVTLAPAMAMGAVWTFNMFNVVFLVSGGEPDGQTEILVSEAYRWAFTRSQQYGYAAAYAVLIFLVLLIFTRGVARRVAEPAGARA